MSRTGQYAALLKKHRTSKRLSARGLSLLAGLSPDYVGNVERGRWVPKPEAHWKLEQALGLEADAAIRLRKAAGIDADLLRAPAIPNLSIWKHLPESLFSVDHVNLALWEAGFDDLLTELVPSMASLLAWASLARKPPTKRERGPLNRAARAYFGASLAHHRQFPQWTPIEDVRPAASNAASVLPRAWRAELFAERRSAERAVKLLNHWAYLPPRFWHGDDRPRLAVQFRGAALNRVYRFAEIPAELIVNTHDAMIAHRLRHDLNLAAEFGVEAKSQQEQKLRGDAGASSTGFADICELLCHLADAARPTAEHTDRQAVDRLKDIRERAKFALRLYELPDLAKAALDCSKDELLAALAAAAEVLHDPDPRHGRKP